MIPTRGYAAPKASLPLEPFHFERREPGEHDIVIDVDFCGVCHSDIHQVRDEWGKGVFPMVPGHEIVGHVSRTGARVNRFKKGDVAGVGCFVDSCRECPNCKAGLEHYCDKGPNFTYNSHEKDGKTPTYGGYSSQLVIDEKYALKVSAKLPLEGVAPLLCAGITTYSPLKHWKVGKGHRLGVLGLGGLGHMAVKLGAAMGAEVTMLSTSKSKEADAKRLGAHHFVLTSEEAQLKSLANHFDFILDTVSAPHNLNTYLNLLKTDGTLVLLGVPPKPPLVETFSLIGRRRSLAGSMIGGIPETQEMLDFCTEKNIPADVEVIPIAQINAAYDRMLKGDVRYRFVIDLKTV